MFVRDIMSEWLVWCMPHNNLQEAACKLLSADCGALPVVEDPYTMRLVGMLTDRDIVCRAVAPGHNPMSTRVDECMSRPVVSVTPCDMLDRCCELMRRHQLRRLAVVDGEGRCCGMISQADLAHFAPRRELADVMESISLPYQAGMARQRDQGLGRARESYR